MLRKIGDRTPPWETPDGFFFHFEFLLLYSTGENLPCKHEVSPLSVVIGSGALSMSMSLGSRLSSTVPKASVRYKATSRVRLQCFFC